MSNAQEQDFESFIGEFESKGAALTNPHLNEGNYKGTITDITTRINEFVYKKGDKAGQDGAMISFQVKTVLDSQTANEVLQRDGDIVRFAGNDCVTINNGNLNVGDYGITRENNISFWKFFGSIFSQVDLATEERDDSGMTTYKFGADLIKSIFKGTQELKAELEANSEVKALTIPYKLAELQIKNLSELVTAESDTKGVYLHIALRSSFRDKAVKEDFIKAIMLPADFEAKPENVDSVIR